MKIIIDSVIVGRALSRVSPLYVYRIEIVGLAD